MDDAVTFRGSDYESVTCNITILSRLGRLLRAFAPSMDINILIPKSVTSLMLSHGALDGPATLLNQTVFLQHKR